MKKEYLEKSFFASLFSRLKGSFSKSLALQKFEYNKEIKLEKSLLNNSARAVKKLALNIEKNKNESFITYIKREFLNNSLKLILLFSISFVAVNLVATLIEREYEISLGIYTRVLFIIIALAALYLSEKDIFRKSSIYNLYSKLIKYGNS